MDSSSKRMAIGLSIITGLFIIAMIMILVKGNTRNDQSASALLAQLSSSDSPQYTSSSDPTVYSTPTIVETVIPTETYSPTPTPTPTISETFTPTPTPTPTVSPTPTITIIITKTPTPTTTSGGGGGITTYYNDAQTATANCSSGKVIYDYTNDTTSSTYSYTVSANSFSSTISKDDANTTALNTAQTRANNDINSLCSYYKKCSYTPKGNENSLCPAGQCPNFSGGFETGRNCSGFGVSDTSQTDADNDCAKDAKEKCDFLGAMYYGCRASTANPCVSTTPTSTPNPTPRITITRIPNPTPTSTPTRIPTSSPRPTTTIILNQPITNASNTSLSDPVKSTATKNIATSTNFYGTTTGEIRTINNATTSTSTISTTTPTTTPAIISNIKSLWTRFRSFFGR